jgi:signal transduction histidine kinase
MVAVSVGIAIVASFAALGMAGCIAAAHPGRNELALLALGAAAMGSGVWAMHFVGMLAYRLPIDVVYAPGLTLLSALIAIAGSGFAFLLVVDGAWQLRRLLLGSAAMGLGIWGMHYMGIAAMRVLPAPIHSPAAMAVSLAIGVAGSALSLRCAFDLRMESPVGALMKKTGSALLMGTTISALHYSAMAGTRFAPGAVALGGAPALQPGTLAAVVTGAALALQLLVLLLASYHAYRAFEASSRASTMAAVKERLDVANRELDMAAGRIAHDLRAPLAVIKGFAQAVAERCGDALDVKARHYLQRIVASTERAERMTDELLAFARLGERPLRRELVELETVVRSAWHSVLPQAGGREVELRIGPLPAVQGDPSLLELAFVNVLSNALKFSLPRERPQIEISARPEGVGTVAVTVKDNGVGFDPAYAQGLFMPFRRLHSRDEFAGSGMGLANVKRIVERHGGSLRAESEHGKGAAFTLTLPATTAAERWDGASVHDWPTKSRT